MRLHSVDLVKRDIEKNLIFITFSKENIDFHLSKFNEKIKLYVIYPDKASGGSKILTFKEGEKIDSMFIEEAEINVAAPNCGKRVVSSKNYIVAACPKYNIITVYSANTKEELCKVNGPANGNIGTDL